MYVDVLNIACVNDGMNFILAWPVEGLGYASCVSFEVGVWLTSRTLVSLALVISDTDDQIGQLHKFYMVERQTHSGESAVWRHNLKVMRVDHDFSLPVSV